MIGTGRRRSSGATRAAGFSLLELMIAVSVLVIGVAFTARSIIASTQLARSNRESVIAVEAARRTIETLRGEAFAQVFARYNPATSDDPGGAAPGPNFVVAGLDPMPDDADGRVGQIVLPTLAGAGSVLRENMNDASLGLPRDLDLDGVVDGADHAANYRILPVLVRVRWRGERGAQQVELRTILGGL
jgi:prepilin-type N-terminal cleavage/methylation domain-containing protein